MRHTPVVVEKSNRPTGLPVGCLLDAVVAGAKSDFRLHDGHQAVLLHCIEGCCSPSSRPDSGRLHHGALDERSCSGLLLSTLRVGASLCTVKKMQQGHQGVQQVVSQPPSRANDRRSPPQGVSQASADCQ